MNFGQFEKGLPETLAAHVFDHRVLDASGLARRAFVQFFLRQSRFFVTLALAQVGSLFSCEVKHFEVEVRVSVTVCSPPAASGHFAQYRVSTGEISRHSLFPALSQMTFVDSGRGSFDILIPPVQNKKTERDGGKGEQKRI